MCREAERYARLSVQSRAPAEINRAVADALRQTAFRFLVVLRINSMAHEQLEKEQIYQALYSAHLALLTRVTDEREAGEYRDWLAVSVQIVLARAAALEAQAEARTIAEERYLDGRTALFPDTAAAWDTSLRTTRQLAVMSLRLAELDGLALPDKDQNVTAQSVYVALADLVEWSRATALEKLGEGERALHIARVWLRPKLNPKPTR